MSRLPYWSVEDYQTKITPGQFEASTSTSIGVLKNGINPKYMVVPAVRSVMSADQIKLQIILNDESKIVVG